MRLRNLKFTLTISFQRMHAGTMVEVLKKLISSLEPSIPAKRKEPASPATLMAQELAAVLLSQSNLLGQGTFGSGRPTLNKIAPQLF